MVRMARWSAAHPWSAIGLWVVFVGLCLFLGSAAGSKKISDAESGVGESGRAGRIVASGRFPAKPEESVLITAAQGGPPSRQAPRTDCSPPRPSPRDIADTRIRVPATPGELLLQRFQQVQPCRIQDRLNLRKRTERDEVLLASTFRLLSTSAPIR